MTATTPDLQLRLYGRFTPPEAFVQQKWRPRLHFSALRAEDRGRPLMPWLVRFELTWGGRGCWFYLLPIRLGHLTPNLRRFGMRRRVSEGS